MTYSCSSWFDRQSCSLLRNFSRIIFSICSFESYTLFVAMANIRISEISTTTGSDFSFV